jgi:branched-subunit amino acid aminotransferase/4-amino-4-deoxychorismate lyase
MKRCSWGTTASWPRGSITNIGFVEGDAVVWPDAPALHGISMQILERELSKAGMPWRRAMVRLADVGSFDGAFITNSRGIAPVGRIDDASLPVGGELVSTVVQIFDAAPWDPI